MKYRRRTVVAGAVLLAGGIALATPAVLDWRSERRLAQVEEDFQKLTREFAEYGIDRCGSFMPPDTWYRRLQNAEGEQTFETDYRFITTYPIPETGKPIPFWNPLRTSADELPVDPFGLGAKYGYLLLHVPDAARPDAGVVRSLGPDGDADLDLDALRADFEEWRRRTATFNGETDTHDAHDWIRERLIPCLYDPTNGTSSSGDILGLKLLYHLTLVDWNTPEAIERMRGYRVAPRVTTADGQPVLLPPSETVAVPPAFVERIDALEMYTHLQAGMEAGHAWDYASNQFRAFTPWFFENPAVLDEEGRRTMAGLRELKPAWWEFIADTGLMDARPSLNNMDRGVFTVFSPLVGKSLLLDAADRAGRGDEEGARRATDQLGVLIGLLDLRDPRQEYIRSRLEAMRASLLKDIEAREGGS